DKILELAEYKQDDPTKKLVGSSCSSIPVGLFGQQWKRLWGVDWLLQEDGKQRSRMLFFATIPILGSIESDLIDPD
ncbi:MAG: hypothetical protein D3905_16325, partial [Candidatus Electrothrix sp. AS4_5]|nr:hypothetical protein [Candidatus Electrothrix gigas]